jgi:DNA gyrase subunit A
MLITNEGIIIRLEVRDISVLGRVTSGVKLMNLDNTKDVVIASIAKVRKDTEELNEDESDVVLPENDEEAQEDTDENS